MKPITATLFLCLVFFALVFFSSSVVHRCSEEPEIPETVLRNFRKDILQSRRFLYGSNRSNIELKKRHVCQVKEGIHSNFLTSLMTLVSELENKGQCTFNANEWRWLKKKLETQGKRITYESASDIYVIPDFLTPQQCQKLVDTHENIANGCINEKWEFATTKQLLEAVYKSSLSPKEYNIFFDLSSDCDGGIIEGFKIGKKMAKFQNFSSSVLVPRGENVFVDFLEQHIQKVVGLPTTNAFHTQLIKYQTDSEYGAHTDCHDIENDRMATIIIYLTDVEEGGETKFPFLNQTIQPKRGMAVVWKNLDSDGKCDVRTTHVAGKVNKGEKYIYQKWFYEKPILPQYQNSDYVFCDLSQSCRQYIYNKSTTMAGQYMNEGQEASNLKEALRNYKIALHHQPYHSASLILYADVLNKLGHSHEALPYLLSLLKMHPRNKDAIELLRLVVENLGKT